MVEISLIVTWDRDRIEGIEGAVVLFVLGAMTVTVAVALLRWSQPLHAGEPALAGVAYAAASQRREDRRVLLRSSRALRVGLVQPEALQAPSPAASARASEPDGLVDGLFDVLAYDEPLGPVEPPAFVYDEPLGPVEPPAFVYDEPLGPIVPPVDAVAPGELTEVDEARLDDEAWERVFAMLRPTEQQLAAAAGALTPAPAEKPARARRTASPRPSSSRPRAAGTTLVAEAPVEVATSTVVPLQRSSGKTAETASASTRTRRCGICREAGHDRRRCPQAA